ncbi:MAG: hypothetical protein HY272_08665 [Gammaproteobacteria bacterium]|nr:hypothetical protein [Gammaproteobacteria bacterium]
MNDDSRLPHPSLHLTEIRILAQRFSSKELEACIGDQLQKGGNVCEPSGRTEEIVSILAKAEFVKALMEKGFTQSEAIRELGRRIRAAQQQGES